MYSQRNSDEDNHLIHRWKLVLLWPLTSII